MTADPLEKIRDGLVAGITEEPARRSRRMLALSVVAIVALGAAGLAFAPSWQDDPPEAVSAGPDPTGTDGGEIVDARPSTTPIDASVWSIEQPSSWWNRAGSELTPASGSESLTLATIAPVAGGDCPRYPAHTVRGMSTVDALVTISYGTSAVTDLETWPSNGFSDNDVPPVEGHELLECAERTDLEVREGRWNLAGQAITALVVFGPDVPDDRRRELWSALGSFGPVMPTEEAPTPICIVTVPPREQPNLPTTADGGAPPPRMGWVGTKDLWTALPHSGVHESPRKSVWWSEHFPGGSVEEAPPVGVRWERLDAHMPAIVAEKPGTNAHTAESGWFMINGLDPDAPGCWKVTADYKGHRLSYVYWNPPRPWSHAAADDAGGDTLLRGNVRFDEDHNCYLLQVEGDRFPIIWPAGTTASPDGAVLRMADDTPIRVGAEVSGRGDIVPVERVDELWIPTGCRGSGRAAVFNAGPPHPRQP